MPDTEKTISPRINLAKSLGSPIPKAGTVDVSFNWNDSTVTLPTDADVSVNPGREKIEFDLSASNVPSGAAVTIEGIEFTKPNEPSGSYAPSNTFEHESTFTDQSGTSHTVYGEWKGNKHFLKLIDNNPPSGEQDYGYRVWIKCVQGTSTNFYCSPDPTIKNKPTTV